MMWNKRVWSTVFTLSLAGCAAGDSEQGATPEAQSRLGQQMRAIPLERVPQDIHRRAAQLLEDVRGTESAPTWSEATLAAEVQPLYRPDVQGVAYYEFRVLSGREPRGFIIASAGAHDFPIAHWSFEGPPPSESLARQAGAEVAAFYKVDALTYVAEGFQGELLATLGTLPPRIVGQEPSWLERPVEPTDVSWELDSVPADDREAESASASRVIRGPSGLPLFQLSGWESWRELKASYREAYGTLAESLRRQAAEEWETEARARESGEGLVVGRAFELALLYSGAEFRLGGEGARVVRAELVDTAPGRQMLVLRAYDARPGTELPLTVDIRYGNGAFESQRFAVLALEDVNSLTEAETSAAGVRWAEFGALGSWSAWNTFWAGSHGAQRLYKQIPSGTWPNNSSCSSGCGATAWAMLFGWGDFQAAQGHPTWAKRWGIYRQNGGYGADAVAPQFMDGGVRNMTWEIRNHIDTFCDPFSQNGPTLPWDMDESYDYLKKRTGASVSTHYNIFGIHEGRLREKARDSIVKRKVPAIIGIGMLQHYPLAYGYRWRSRTVKILFWDTIEYQRQFYINNGGGGTASNDWVGAGTWFAGQLYAN